MEETIHSIYYIVHAECSTSYKDGEGEIKTQSLGNIRGMSDNGQPGWSNWGAIQFKSLSDAVEAAKHPYSYSAWQAHYKGGKVWIVETEKHITTITLTREHQIIS